jgi:mannose/fructose-specific phosphotransferase system component IIA
MIKGLVITHGNLGGELISVVEQIFGKKVDVDFFSFDWEEDGSKTLKKFEHYLKENQEHKILIFTDMFGGSPTNICYKFSGKNTEVISGVNLPCLIKFLTYRNKKISFKELVKVTKKGAIEGINLISDYLGER